MQVCIFEDTKISDLLPLVYFRPVYDLRCGPLTLLEKLRRSLPPSASLLLHTRRELAEYVKEIYPGSRINAVTRADILLVNGRAMLTLTGIRRMQKSQKRSVVFRIGEEVAAAFIASADLPKFESLLAGELFAPNCFEGFPSEEIEGSMVRYPWDLIHRAPAQIEEDFGLLRTNKKVTGKVYTGAHLLNKGAILIGKGSIIKPGVVLDAEKGPIIIGNQVTLMPNAVIEGPASIGDNTVIKVGAKIYHGTAIGEWCKVGGEVENSILQSYSNKQHDGFLGHSYLSSWVNLGADTNTSDLKNTYGTVKVAVNGVPTDSGQQFVGLIIGDHSKSGINVMFDTGTIVGAACNIYGAGLPPKYLPSFSWGTEGKFSTYQLEKSIEIARKVMSRRGVMMSPAYEQRMREVFMVTEPERRNFRSIR